MDHLISIDHDGTRYENFTAADLLTAGVPRAIVDASVDAFLIKQSEERIDRLGDRLSGSPSRAARYRQKHREAVAYIAAGKPGNVSETDYPVLVPEAAARKTGKGDLADLIVARAAVFNAIMGSAEALRASLPDIVAGQAGIDAKQTAIDDAIKPFADQVAAALA